MAHGGHHCLGFMAYTDHAHAHGVESGEQLAYVVTHQAEHGVHAQVLQVLGEDLIDG